MSVFVAAKNNKKLSLKNIKFKICILKKKYFYVFLTQKNIHQKTTHILFLAEKSLDQIF